MAAVAALGVVLVGATASHLEVLAPTGPHAVGRERITWTDTSRLETHTPAVSDHRVVPAQLWFPAKPGSGRKTGYVPDLAAISDGLVRSGELGRAPVWGLRWVRHHSFDGARIATREPAYPLVVLSPGNATNVGFYATIAEELASRGYVVMGIDHPYQVAAVALPDGSVATYDQAADRVGQDPSTSQAAKITERVDDIAFALDQVRATPALLGGRIDLDRVAVIGHSNGGVAAAEVCRRLAEIRACANLDGQAAGGPFSTQPDQGAPSQPFLFLTKDSQLHPVLGERFEAAAGTYRAVVPAASHDGFTDGALFRPSFNPLTRTVDRVAETSRGFLAAFLDVNLRDASPTLMGSVPASTDLYVNAYPLGDKPPIPQE